MGMDYSLVQRIIDGLGKILDTKPGSPDEGTYVTEQQLADWIKGQTVVPAYYYNGVMYSDALHTMPITGQAGALYIDQDNNVLYRWDGAAWDAMSDSQLRQDILDGTVIAKKAECDQNGNVIDTTYATKAELQTEVTNLNNALSAMDKRVENLEEAHGSYHEVDVKSVYTIPSGKGSNWLIDGLRGVSRVDNNILDTSSVSTQTVNGVTATKNADGSWTINGTATADSSSTNIIKLGKAVRTVGHTYLYKGIKGASDSCLIFMYGADNTRVTNEVGAIYAYTTADANTNVMLWCANGTVFNNVTYYPLITDLTVYFNGTIPSDADSISEIQTNYPWLLTPSDYGTSGVNTVYEGVRSIGVNIWDEVWQAGGLNISTGADDDTRTNRVRSENYIPVNQYKTYYYLDNSETWWAYFYDADKNFIGRNAVMGTTSFYPLAGSFFMRFETWNGYGNVYKYDVQISEVFNNTVTTLNTTYHPYFKRTLTFPSPISLKSAGAVAEEYYPETGRETHPIGEHIITGNETLNYGTWAENTISLIFPGARPLARGNSKCLTSIYENVTAVVAGGLTYARFVGATSRWANLDDFKADAVGKTIYYELATPSADTYVDPILDNLISTEPGGTIESILTNPVDDSMTLGYINL